MGGEVPTSPTDPHEPTVAEWSVFMTALANAPTTAIVSMTIQDATGIPTVADFRVPATWISVSPRFAVKPPVVEPPPLVPVIMYVVSSNGVFLHKTADTTIASRSGSLLFGAVVKVNPESLLANGYLWRTIATNESNAGLLVAEKSIDGATVILSATPPK